MNIYIYGNQSFKKEILETLEHSNIKFKLDESTLIKEINSINELKQTIKSNPKDIYLIDDEKIIKKNSFKFLNPKDGIEEEFLLDSGIADLSVDSIKEIPKYIIRKYDEQKSIESQTTTEEEMTSDKDIELDEELALLLAKEEEPKEDVKPEKEKDLKEDNLFKEEDNLSDIFGENNSSVNLDELDNLLTNESKGENLKEDNIDFNDSFGLNNISFDYDDDEILNDKNDNLDDEALLKSLLDESDDEESIEEVFEDINFLDEILPIKNSENSTVDLIEDFSKNDEKFELEDIELLEDFDKVEENEIQNLDTFQGDKMGEDEFFELDSLNEKDLLEALNFNNSNNTQTNKIEPKINLSNTSSTNNESITINSSEINDLSLLISKLLNNKTLEITIKIKD